MAQDASVAPKERVNIVYQASTGGARQEKELPLKVLVMGDFTQRDDTTPLEERKPVNVTKDNFDDVIASQQISLDIQVPNRLAQDGGDLPVQLAIRSLQDFGPESIARQVPELSKLLELREALSALKGPLGNVPAFRKKIQDLIADPAARAALLQELGAAAT
ncbi:MAG: type VI secretion system contractile sheath small subunit [Planctomycetes bacterium]|nr:type VI secretion system contractile sheath small subunit [Planctomycetota bacterium]